MINACFMLDLIRGMLFSYYKYMKYLILYNGFILYKPAATPALYPAKYSSA